MSDASPSAVRRVLTHPATRIVLFLVAIAIAAILEDVVLGLLGMLVPLGAGPVGQGASVLLLVVAVHLAYAGTVRVLERRPASELRFADLGTRLGTGLLVGFGLITSVVAILAALGYYRVTGSGTLAAGASMLVLAIASGYVEEIVIRGVLFRLLEEGLGTWIALGITALTFGALHLGNPNAGWMGTITIAATAGVLLAGAYVWTRSLWTPIGIHIAWNFTEGGIFAVPVSGLDRAGLLESRLEGPELLTGGPFGPEASLLTLVLGTAAAAVILRLAARRGNLVRPFWRRDRDGVGEDLTGQPPVGPPAASTP